MPSSVMLPSNLLLTELLTLTGQNSPIDFHRYVENSPLLAGYISKIAQGTFSHVFAVDDLVLKSLKFGGPDDMSTIEGTFRELKMTMTMSQVGGFSNFVAAAVVSGSYPQRLLEASNLWAETHTENQLFTAGSHDDKQQLYLVVIMRNGGLALSKVIMTWKEALEIWHQTTSILANAEEAVEFEHRDMHRNNILVAFDENGMPKVTLVDLGFSRATIEGRVLNHPMDIPIMFTGCDVLCQGNVYRFMRKLAAVSNADGSIMNKAARIRVNEETDAKWDLFLPQTNVAWLYYLANYFLREHAPLKVPTQEGNPVDWVYYDKFECIIEELEFLGQHPCRFPRSARQVLTWAAEIHLFD